MRDFMFVLVTCKNEEDLIKNEDARSGHSNASMSMDKFSPFNDMYNSKVKSPIWFKINLVRAFIVVPVTYMNKEPPIKNEGARVVEFSIISQWETSVTMETRVVFSSPKPKAHG